MVEGVKDAAALNGLGYLAVGLPTSSMNSKFSSLFAGVSVVVVPDLDIAGQSGAAKTAANLKAAEASVAVATLPGELRESKGIDVRDVLQQSDGENLVRQAIAAAQPSDDGVAAIDPVQCITSKKFFATEYRLNYLVEGVLAEGMATIMAGRSKTLKTTLAIDLALSIGTGTKFLSRWQAHRRRVLLLSGESGDFTVQETARRIAAARGIDPATADVLWGFDLPCIGGEPGLQSLELTLRGNNINVLILDPIYLSLMGEETKGLNSGSLFDIGPLLLRIAKMCKRCDVTPILLHHNRKNSPNFKFSPPELEEISGAGFGEFARQWILLGRRSEYASDGKHELWLQFGGSAGHGGLYALDVDEGRLDDSGGRKWITSMNTPDVAQQVRKQQREIAKEKQKVDGRNETRNLIRSTMLEFPEGETARTVRDRARLSHEIVSTLVEGMEADGLVERCKITKSNRPYGAWRLTERGRSDDWDEWDERDSERFCTGSPTGAIEPVEVGGTGPPLHRGTIPSHSPEHGQLVSDPLDVSSPPQRPPNSALPADAEREEVTV